MRLAPLLLAAACVSDEPEFGSAVEAMDTAVFDTADTGEAPIEDCDVAFTNTGPCTVEAHDGVLIHELVQQALAEDPSVIQVHYAGPGGEAFEAQHALREEMGPCVTWQSMDFLADHGLLEATDSACEPVDSMQVSTFDSSDVVLVEMRNSFVDQLFEDAGIAEDIGLEHMEEYRDEMWAYTGVHAPLRGRIAGVATVIHAFGTGEAGTLDHSLFHTAEFVDYNQSADPNGSTWVMAFNTETTEMGIEDMRPLTWVLGRLEMPHEYPDNPEMTAQLETHLDNTCPGWR